MKSTPVLCRKSWFVEICGKRLVHRLKEGFFPLFGDKHNIAVTITNTYFPRLGKKYLDVNSLHICKFVWPRTIFTWEFPSVMRINVSICTTARNWNAKGLNWEGGKVVTFFSVIYISLKKCIWYGDVFCYAVLRTS